MPYKVKCNCGGDCCKVQKKGTRKTYSKKPMSLQKAMAQMRALYLAEKKRPLGIKRKKKK